MSYFNYLVKINLLHARALRTIVSPDCRSDLVHSYSYDADRSIRSASLRSSVAGVHVKRAGKNTLLPNSTRPLTAGLTQFRITVGLALEYLRLALS